VLCKISCNLKKEKYLLIVSCLTSSEQYAGHIHDEIKFTNNISTRDGSRRIC